MTSCMKNVTWSLIGWGHTQNGPCFWAKKWQQIVTVHDYVCWVQLCSPSTISANQTPLLTSSDLSIESAPQPAYMLNKSVWYMRWVIVAMRGGCGYCWLWANTAIMHMNHKWSQPGSHDDETHRHSRGGTCEDREVMRRTSHEGPGCAHGPLGRESTSVPVHHDAMTWKAFLIGGALWGECNRWPGDSPHKGHYCGALTFSLLLTWTSYTNSHVASDLRHHDAHVTSL